MFSKLKAELDAVMERDPAARSRAEVYFLYAGFKAVRAYRRANWFYRHDMKFIARMISQRARRRTGIEIHPGAKIGKNLFIDHGMGVVIGETTEIGDNCTLYQGVTLGGTGKDHGKRHPTLGDNVRVAAGAVVLNEVPDDATAVGVPARVVRIGGKRVNSALDQIHVVDPVAQEMCRLRVEIMHMHEALEEKNTEESEES